MPVTASAMRHRGGYALRQRWQAESHRFRHCRRCSHTSLSSSFPAFVSLCLCLSCVRFVFRLRSFVFVFVFVVVDFAARRTLQGLS